MSTHTQVEMTPLYEKYPLLKTVEEKIDPRFERRLSITYQIPKHKVGAEIGVFTGQFSEMLLQTARPKHFYAIDPWFTAWGETFPDWGDYSAGGRLETRAGYEATLHRTERFPGVEVIAASALDWIGTLEPGALDWAYVDSTHQYEPTLAELRALSRVLADDGVLLGDDCWPNRQHHHYGVYRAVRDFCREFNFEITEMAGGQWAARRSID